jgi:ArsR family transcriptional regulator, arsenate/arsenite/antimonite-responsive transcriptional repressor
MTETEAIRALGALAQELRLRVFRQLVMAEPTGLTPSQLTEVLGVSATALSFHLKELTHAQLITQERQGRHLIYRATFPTMNALLAYLTDHCCQGVACEVSQDLSCVRPLTSLDACGETVHKNQ